MSAVVDRYGRTITWDGGTATAVDPTDGTSFTVSGAIDPVATIEGLAPAWYRPELPPITTTSIASFVDRFTQGEQVAAVSNPQTLTLWMMLLAYPEIDMTHPRVVAGMAALVTAGVLTPERSATILDLAQTSPDMPGITTITIPPTSTALASVAAVKTRLRVSDSADDSLLSALIEDASDTIAQHLGQPLGVQTISEVFRFGAGSYIGPSAQAVAPFGTPLLSDFRPLITTFRPVAAVISVTENSDPSLTSGDDFEVDYPAGLLYRLRNGLRSWWNVPAVAVVYQSGYNLPNDTPASGIAALPNLFTRIVAELVLPVYAAGGRDPAIIRDRTEGVGQVDYSPAIAAGMALTDDQRRDLEPWRARV